MDWEEKAEDWRLSALYSALSLEQAYLAGVRDALEAAAKLGRVKTRASLRPQSGQDNGVSIVQRLPRPHAQGAPMSKTRDMAAKEYVDGWEQSDETWTVADTSFKAGWDAREPELTRLREQNKIMQRACQRYEQAFGAIEAQMSIRPGIFYGVWSRQMATILGDAREAIRRADERGAG